MDSDSSSSNSGKGAAAAVVRGNLDRQLGRHVKSRHLHMVSLHTVMTNTLSRLQIASLSTCVTSMMTYCCSHVPAGACVCLSVSVGCCCCRLPRTPAAQWQPL